MAVGVLEIWNSRQRFECLCAYKHILLQTNADKYLTILTTRTIMYKGILIQTSIEQPEFTSYGITMLGHIMITGNLKPGLLSSDSTVTLAASQVPSPNG